MPQASVASANHGTPSGSGSFWEGSERLEQAGIVDARSASARTERVRERTPRRESGGAFIECSVYLTVGEAMVSSGNPSDPLSGGERVVCERSEQTGRGAEFVQKYPSPVISLARDDGLSPAGRGVGLAGSMPLLPRLSMVRRVRVGEEESSTGTPTLHQRGKGVGDRVCCSRSVELDRNLVVPVLDIVHVSRSTPGERDGADAAVAEADLATGGMSRAPVVVVAAITGRILDDDDIAAACAAIGTREDVFIPAAGTGVGIHARIDRLLADKHGIARTVHRGDVGEVDPGIVADREIVSATPGIDRDGIVRVRAAVLRRTARAGIGEWDAIPRRTHVNLDALRNAAARRSRAPVGD